MDKREAQDVVNKLCEHFLGADWYISDPVTNEQANAIILEEIMERFPSGRLRRVPKRRCKCCGRKEKNR